jgi:phosphopantothenoylcysteine synthetase/decarboxylase
VASEEQRFSQANCNAFRPKLDSSGGLSKNMLGQGYQVKLFQHHPNNLASEAFNGFFSKKRMMEIIGDGNGGGDDDDNDDVDVGDLEDDVEKNQRR